MSLSQLPEVLCAGCGWQADADEPYPFRCVRRGRGDHDHLMTPQLRLGSEVIAAFECDESNPFVRFRRLSYSYHVARAHGMSDQDYVALVRQLDGEVAKVDGAGFELSPFTRCDALSARLGAGERGGLWIKDETGNVSGSHKARHLMGVAVYLRVIDALGKAPSSPARLAIASCGNAALAAAVVARAMDRALVVFIPPDADRSVVERLEALQAEVVVCPRPVNGGAGDPTYSAFQDALKAGALPFCCQGSDNGLTVMGGETLAYEVVAQLKVQGTALDHLFIQVGGGALGSSVVQGLWRCRQLGLIETMPRIHTVQTRGAWPLKRAYDRVLAMAETRLVARNPAEEQQLIAEVLRYASKHRSRFMWPWERQPQSIARGILDDETYDWCVLVRAMLETRGRPFVVSEETLEVAHRLGRQYTGLDVCATGTAGLAGLMDYRRLGGVVPTDRVGLIFSGHRR